jgi:hypothetical protein
MEKSEKGCVPKALTDRESQLVDMAEELIKGGTVTPSQMRHLLEIKQFYRA